MPDRTPMDLAVARLEQAAECLRDAEDDIAKSAFKSAANRSYYCIYHSIRSVLALDRFDSKKHSSVINAFSMNYIKTKIFPLEYSKVIGNAFRVRNNSDYDEFYAVSKSEVLTQVENARKLLMAVKEYIGGRED